MTGKGGVGKTVIAAALGSLLADAGREVLILEADPRENLHHLFGVEPSGGEVVRAGRRLALRNASPRAILDEAVRRRLKLGALSRRVLASPIYHHFADGAPGLKEMMLLGHALEVTQGVTDHEADVVVIDAPASGHGLALLAAPLLVAEVIGHGPIGTMAGQIAALVKDPARCQVVLATLAEEMAVQETLETAAQLEQRLGRTPSLIVANAIWPALPPELARPSRAPRPASQAPDDETLSLWRTRSAHQEGQLERLRGAWKGAMARVPLIGADFGPALLDDVRASLAGQVP